LKTPLPSTLNYHGQVSQLILAQRGGRGYFCRSSGNVTDEVIKAYIESQSHDSDEVFRLEGEESPPEEPPSA
jgi:hypothetical protein